MIYAVISNLEGGLGRPFGERGCSIFFTASLRTPKLALGFIPVVKKSQKTLKKDLELAKQRKSLFKKG